MESVGIQVMWLTIDFFLLMSKALLISKFKDTTKVMFCVGSPAGCRAEPFTVLTVAWGWTCRLWLQKPASSANAPPVWESPGISFFLSLSPKCSLSVLLVHISSPWRCRGSLPACPQPCPDFWSGVSEQSGLWKTNLFVKDVFQNLSEHFKECFYFSKPFELVPL